MDFILAIKWDHLVAIIVGNVSLFSFDPYLVVSNKMNLFKTTLAPKYVVLLHNIVLAILTK